jgi:hypothetical protein
MHVGRSTDPRSKQVEEGLNPLQVQYHFSFLPHFHSFFLVFVQVLLDQAAHLMDAVTLGKFDRNWENVRKDIAQRYHDGGYVDIAKFVETVN